ncbi:MAG: adenylate kinase [Bacteroidia bacterium]|jgi:adenylate kinase|nr:adenylate kinase [Bacteroidia bacterium]
MLNLILFGPPGAGKGTQSEQLIDAYDLKHISTGDLLRAERKAGTELGVKANEYIAKGELVPDEVVVGMVRNFMKEHSSSKGFIFDGFPRTTPQAEALDNLLAEFGAKIDVVLGLEVNEDELVKRLLLRGETSGRADDQSEETIRNRFKEYQTKTLPLMDYYTKKNSYVGVNGMGEIDQIQTSLIEEINKVL